MWSTTQQGGTVTFQDQSSGFNLADYHITLERSGAAWHKDFNNEHAYGKFKGALDYPSSSPPTRTVDKQTKKVANNINTSSANKTPLPQPLTPNVHTRSPLSSSASPISHLPSSNPTTPYTPVQLPLTSTPATEVLLVSRPSSPIMPSSPFISYGSSTLFETPPKISKKGDSDNDNDDDDLLDYYDEDTVYEETSVMEHMGLSFSNMDEAVDLEEYRKSSSESPEDISEAQQALDEEDNSHLDDVQVEDEISVSEAHSALNSDILEKLNLHADERTSGKDKPKKLVAVTVARSPRKLRTRIIPRTKVTFVEREEEEVDDIIDPDDANEFDETDLTNRPVKK